MIVGNRTRALQTKRSSGHDTKKTNRNTKMGWKKMNYRMDCYMFVKCVKLR